MAGERGLFVSGEQHYVMFGDGDGDDHRRAHRRSPATRCSGTAASSCCGSKPSFSRAEALELAESVD